ncbi:protein Wnt-4-like [Poecile atricapillus]|uniref:protein Wnt-4-like n=1 Tax=Poecile atricapillus TaxID=48891 RepID=UPI0027389E82|nr:protein Wnt-4-like [Poecile atricapillus]
MDRMELVWLHVMLIHVQHIAAVTWLSLTKQISLQAALQDPRGCDGLMGQVEEQVEAMEAVNDSLFSHPVPHKCLCPLQTGAISCPAAGTQESAFICTISTASFAFAVTRACSHRELHKRGCDHKIRGVSPEGGRSGQQGESFQWSGCYDNLFYGIDFSQAFVDSPERSHSVSSSRMLINLHNNEAGRKGSPMLPEESASCCLSWPSTVLITLSWLLPVWRGSQPPLHSFVQSPFPRTPPMI